MSDYEAGYKQGKFDAQMDAIQTLTALCEAIREKRPQQYLGRVGYMEGYDNACEDIIALIRTTLTQNSNPKN